jgi:hypothetical protein
MTGQPIQPITVDEHASRLGRLIIDEIIYAFGGKRNGWLQKLTTPLLRKPAQHFGHIAAEFYDQVNRLGVSQGRRPLYPALSTRFRLAG